MNNGEKKVPVFEEHLLYLNVNIHRRVFLNSYVLKVSQ